jgi:hypothetical protein
LDQVQHRHAGPHVAACDGDDQPQVGPDEQVLRALTLGDEPLQFLPADAAANLALIEQVLGVEARLDCLESSTSRAASNSGVREISCR